MAVVIKMHEIEPIIPELYAGTLTAQLGTFKQIRMMGIMWLVE